MMRPRFAYRPTNDYWEIYDLDRDERVATVRTRKEARELAREKNEIARITHSQRRELSR